MDISLFSCNYAICWFYISDKCYIIKKNLLYVSLLRIFFTIAIFYIYRYMYIYWYLLVFEKIYSWHLFYDWIVRVQFPRMILCVDLEIRFL